MAIALQRQWRRQQCNIHQQSPVPRKTIPAKAGISQSYVANNAKIRRTTIAKVARRAKNLAKINALPFPPRRRNVMPCKKY